jgi:hypothetical protein
MGTRCCFGKLAKHLVTIWFTNDAEPFQKESLLLNTLLTQRNPEILIPGTDMNHPRPMIAKYAPLPRGQNDAIEPSREFLPIGQNPYEIEDVLLFEQVPISCSRPFAINNQSGLFSAIVVWRFGPIVFF